MSTRLARLFRAWLRPLASFGSGFAVMGAEVAAGRLLAPAFGTSTLVWSSLIGVVLLGLAGGAIIGGRIARRPNALQRVFVATTLAGAAFCAVPALARPLMRGALEQFMHGHLFALVLGFAGTLLLLVVPVVALGALGPVLVHHAARDRDDVGSASGLLSAAGTIGSLAGTFVCGIVLVPLLGTSWTFFVCGGLAGATGVVGLAGFVGASRARRPAVAVAAAIVVAIALPRIAAASPHGNGAVIVERETPYNFVRVVDDGEHRVMTMNEGYASQTIARLDGNPYLKGVWGYYAIAPMLSKEAPARILVLGLGGGTSARGYAERLPKAEIVAVELDPGVVDVARKQFGLPSSVEVHVGDARAFLARDSRTYDLVVIDAFQFPYVPFQLTTREFFEDVAKHLSTGGAVMVNAGRKGAQLDVVHAIASTMQTVLPHVNGANVPATTNTILVATRHPLEDAGGRRNMSLSATEDAELADLAQLEPWVVPPSARLVLTDDRAPVEWLTNRIIVRELSRMAKGGR